jgi:hypothetical protein
MILFTHRKVRRRFKVRRSQGAILLVALAAMVIVTAIASAVASATLRTRQSRKTERDRIQLKLLCDAGVMRARDQWMQFQDYRGETWIDIDSPIGPDRWKVTITMEPPVTETTKEVQFVVQARMENRSYVPHELQETRKLQLPIEPKS